MLKICHWLLICTVYLLLCGKALFEFSTDWDFLSYHLPGALSRFGLTSLIPHWRAQAVYEGFPPLANTLQGLLALICGRISAANSLNATGLLLCLCGLKLLFKKELSLRWFLTFCLSIPLIVRHIYCGHIDLWSNLFLMLAFAALIKLFENNNNRQAQLIFFCSIAASVFSKYQTWPIASLLSSVFVFSLLKDFSKNRRLLAFSILALGLIFFSWPVRNYVVYSNPVYPIVPSFSPKGTPGIRSLGAKRPRAENTPEYLHQSTNFFRFISSAYELNRFQSSPYKFEWSHAQNEIEKTWPEPAPVSPHHRMGGWFFVSMGVLSFLFLLALFRGAISIPVGATFLGCFVLTAVLPQSHELRYWLYIPLSLILLLVLHEKSYPRHILITARGILAICGGYVLYSLSPYPINWSTPDAYAPHAAKAFWVLHLGESETICITAPRNMSLFFAGPSFTEIPVKYCEEN
jgi:hypothetical protein